MKNITFDIASQNDKLKWIAEITDPASYSKLLQLDGANVYGHF